MNFSRSTLEHMTDEELRQQQELLMDVAEEREVRGMLLENSGDEGNDATEGLISDLSGATGHAETSGVPAHSSSGPTTPPRPRARSPLFLQGYNSPIETFANTFAWPVTPSPSPTTQARTFARRYADMRFEHRQRLRIDCVAIPLRSARDEEVARVSTRRSHLPPRTSRARPPPQPTSTPFRIVIPGPDSDRRALGVGTSTARASSSAARTGRGSSSTRQPVAGPSSAGPSIITNKSCHHCKKANDYAKMGCAGGRCKLLYCENCIVNFYDAVDFDSDNEDVECPKCRGVCVCKVCNAKRKKD